MEPASTVSIKGKALTLTTEADCVAVLQTLGSNAEATHVVLSGNSIGKEAAIILAGAIAKLPVEVADFSDIFTAKSRQEIPPAVTALSTALNKEKVEVLNFSDNAFGPDGVQAFVTFLHDNKRLRVLNVNNTGLGPDGGALLAAGLQSGNTSADSYTCQLEEFVAGRSRLEDRGASGLADAFSKMDTLKVLRVPQSGITAAGMVPLAKSIAKNLLIEELDLYDNNIGKGASEMAKALSTLKSLKNLNLGDCMLGSKGVQAILEAIQHTTSLQSLDLSYSGMTDSHLPLLESVLKNNPAIVSLQLNGNAFTSSKGLEALEELVDALGKKAILGELDENDSSVDEESSETSEEELTEKMSYLKI